MVPTLAEGFDPALGRRVASGVVLGTAALACVFAGGWIFAVLVLLAVFFMAREWAGLARPGTGEARLFLAGLAAALPGVAVLAAMLQEAELAVLILGLGAMGAAGLAAAIPGASVNRAAAGVIYLGLPAVALVWLREHDSGLGWVVWLLAVVWATDITAYFVGRTVGGPKLAPAISPGKTISGLVGGMAGAALIGAGLAGALEIGIAGAAPLGALLAVVAQAGDLFESGLKRRAGVKDSGTLIPGHGGALDRLDGLLFAAPAFAAAMLLFGIGDR